MFIAVHNKQELNWELYKIPLNLLVVNGMQHNCKLKVNFSINYTVHGFLENLQELHAKVGYRMIPRAYLLDLL